MRSALAVVVALALGVVASGCSVMHSVTSYERSPARQLELAHPLGLSSSGGPPVWIWVRRASHANCETSPFTGLGDAIAALEAAGIAVHSAESSPLDEPPQKCGAITGYFVMLIAAADQAKAELHGWHKFRRY